MKIVCYLQIFTSLLLFSCYTKMKNKQRVKYDGERESRYTTHTQKEKTKGYKPIWIVISFIALIVILLLPTPTGLPVMAKGALAILAFAVIIV